MPGEFDDIIRKMMLEAQLQQSESMQQYTRPPSVSSQNPPLRSGPNHRFFNGNDRSVEGADQMLNGKPERLVPGTDMYHDLINQMLLDGGTES